MVTEAQIYGFAYQSPLLLRPLVPPKRYQSLYIDHRWTQNDLKANLEKDLRALLSNKKTAVVFAHSLASLQTFLRLFQVGKDFQAKLILHDFPSLLSPMLHPLIEWLDCDHQAGGAWQITKMKPETFIDLLEQLPEFSPENVETVLKMSRFVPRQKLSEIEKIVDYLPDSYKQILDAPEEKPIENLKQLDSEYSKKDIKWKKKTLTQLLSAFVSHLDDPEKRVIMVNTAIDYQVGDLTAREYNAKVTKLAGGDEGLKKQIVLIRKWMDDSKLGVPLHDAYLDYLANSSRRAWKTILEENPPTCAEDLLLLIGKHPRSEELLAQCKDDLKEAKERPANQNPPEPIYKWADGSKNYHPEPVPISELWT